MYKSISLGISTRGRAEPYTEPMITFSVIKLQCGNCHRVFARRRTNNNRGSALAGTRIRLFDSLAETDHFESVVRTSSFGQTSHGFHEVLPTRVNAIRISCLHAAAPSS